MATPSSILDWRIPWTEDPGRLQSMGSQRVRSNSHTHALTHVRASLIAGLVKKLPVRQETPV